MPARDFQLSMGQLAEVVLYGALGAFAVTPLVRSVQLIDNGPSVAFASLIGGIVVALVWALLLRLTARGRPLRSWLSNALTIVPFAIAAAGATALAAHAWYPALRGRSPDAGLFVLASVVAATFDGLLVVLARHVWPRRCPACGRRGLIRDARDASSDPAPVRGLWPAAWCLRCGARARRLAAGWTAAADPIEALTSPFPTAPRA